MQAAFQRRAKEGQYKPLEISVLREGRMTDSWGSRPAPVILAQGGGFQPMRGDFYLCERERHRICIRGSHNPLSSLTGSAI